MTKKKNNKKIIYFILIILFVAIFFFFFPIKQINLFKNLFKTFNLNNFVQEAKQEELINLQNQLIILKEENRNLSNQLIKQTNKGIEKKKINLKLISSKSRIYGSFYLEILNFENVNNLSKGDLIYTDENLLVGEIEEVNNNLLKVNLLGSKNSFLAKSIESDEIIELKSSGINLYKGDIPTNAMMEIGELIVYKDDNNSIIGNIVDISESNNSIKTVWIRTPINLNKVQNFYVYIK